MERDKQQDGEIERQTGGGGVSDLTAENARKAERHGSVPLRDFCFFFRQTVCSELMFYITASGFSHTRSVSFSIFILHVH